MILQALVKRYEDSGSGSPGWQERKADYAININDGGSILDVISLEQIDGKKKTRQRLCLPEEPRGRTRGVKAALLCDNAGYLFGMDSTRGEEKFKASKDLHLSVLKNVNSVAAAAIKNYYKRIPKKREDLDEQKNNCVFMVNGKYAYEDSEIVSAWDSYCKSSVSGDLKRCLVSGKMSRVPELQGKVSLPGVSMGAVPLISINAESFASYGTRASNPAAQIGEKAAFAYTTALNDLLKSASHHKRLGGDTIVYWAEEGGEAEAEAFSFLTEPKEDDTEKLNGLMENVTKGKSIDIDNCKPDRKFYILGLSPNAGRISVRFFLFNTFGNIVWNIVSHYENLKIVAPKNDKFPYISPWTLLSETTAAKKTKGSDDTLAIKIKTKTTASKKDKKDKKDKKAKGATPLLGGQILSSIITGKPYPKTLYNAIINRVRANEQINKTKAAIVKAVLIRNYKEKEVTTMSLNSDSSNKPYVLGRLFAVLEQLQKSASDGKLNSTIRDGYFSRACANPRTVFPMLLKLSMHHASKSAYAPRYEKPKEELLNKLDVEEVPFPATLSYEDQGRFILGYYHQTQDLFPSKKELNSESSKEDKNNE